MTGGKIKPYLKPNKIQQFSLDLRLCNRFGIEIALLTLSRYTLLIQVTFIQAESLLTCDVAAG